MHFEKYLEEINTKFPDSLELINKAVLAGEYYGKGCEELLDKIINRLSELKTKVKQIEQNEPLHENSIDIIQTSSDSIVESGIDAKDISEERADSSQSVSDNIIVDEKTLKIHQDAVSNCKALISRTLGNFVKIIDKKKEDPDTVHLHHNIDVEMTKLDTKFEQNPQDGLDLILLHINLALIEIDEFLDCEGNTIAILRGYKEFFDKKKLTNIGTAGQKLIIKVLEDKIIYLSEKIAIRKNCSTKKHSEIKDEKVLNDNVFSHFYKLTLSHYQNTTLINLDYLKKLDKDIPFTNLQEVHLLNRKIRKFVYVNNVTQIDFKKITKFIDKLVSLLEKKINEEERYDEFAYCSCINMLLNTKYDIGLITVEKNGYEELNDDQSSLDLKAYISNQVDIIESFQNEKYINDFYPYQSLLSFINKVIDNKIRDNIQCLGIDKELLSEDNKKENFEKIALKLESIKEEYIKVYHLFEENLSWCRTHRYNPIYLPISECRINYNNIDIFLDSAYILPCDYSHLERQWYMAESDIKSNIRSLKNRVQIEIDKILLQKSAKDIKEETKKSEIRAIQVISLFLSVAVFSLVSVKVVFENKNIWGSFAAMFGFGGCLLLFNAVFHWLVNWPQISNQDPKYKGFGNKIIYSSICFLLVSGLLTCQSNNQINAMQEKSTSKTLDSLSKILKDSIAVIHKNHTIEKHSSNNKEK